MQEHQPKRGQKRPLDSVTPGSDDDGTAGRSDTNHAPELQEPDDPTNENDESLAPNSRKRKRTERSKGKPRAGDYTGIDKVILEVAQTEFQIRVSTEYAYPEERNEDARTWAKECWKNACTQTDESLSMTPELQRLVCTLCALSLSIRVLLFTFRL